jgi:bifunctional non-homologous end joining protein LigD
MGALTISEDERRDTAMATANQSTTLELDGHEVKVTSADKVMYPETGTTKRDVIDYLLAVADVMLPRLRDRVVTRIRYPDGTGGKRFYERHAPKSMPEWIRAVTVSASPGTEKDAKQVRYPVVGDRAGLAWMANQAALELHVPQWRVGPRGGIGKPDTMVFDLDPGEGAGLDDCAGVAHLLAKRIADEGLTLVPLTSGKKGIHLYARVDGRRSAMTVHELAMRVARELAGDYPEQVVARSGKDERVGKVFIDWSQNHPARSTVVPYSLRGLARPTVAAPRTWDEIVPGLQQLSPAEVLERLERDGDLLVAAGWPG